MKCVVAEYSGFCHGVEHTIETVETLLASGAGDVYSIGLPVHNRQVTQKLVERGLKVVDSIDEIQRGTLVIRAHGLPPQIIARAKQKHLEVVNTTCGFVLKAQEIAKLLETEGYSVVIVGEAEHPEVKSILGMTDNKAFICASLEDAQKIPAAEKVGILSQTTFSEAVFKQIVSILIERDFSEIRVFDTICSSIEKRHTNAIMVAEEVDLMLAVGGAMSSNTKRLYEACKGVNSNCYHIETKEDVKKTWLNNVKSVGITGGASTPPWVINDIRMVIAEM